MSKPTETTPGHFGEVYIVPHAHLDLTWLGTPAQCTRNNNAVIAAALDLLGAHPDYRYTIECVRPLEQFLESQPGRVDEVRRYYSEGRLEVGAQYVDVAGDTAFARALAGNVRLGQQWLVHTLGAASPTAREEDVDGHFAQLPALLSAAGVAYFKISRGPAGAFIWRAPGGAEVLCARFEYNHGYHFRLGRSPQETLRRLPGYLRWMRRNTDPPLDALMLMDGDDGTMPNAALPEIVTAWNSRHARPKLRLATTREFCEALPRQVLPVRCGDLPGMWGFVMLFEQEVARMFEDAARVFAAAEGLSAACAFFMGQAEPVPGRAWRQLLAALDHNWGGKDPSRNGPAADRDKRDMIRTACDLAAQTRDRCVDHLGSGIQSTGDGVPVLVYNPLAWERSAVSRCALPDSLRGAQLRAVSCRGVEAPCEVRGNEALFQTDNLPSLGYEVYYLQKTQRAAAAETPTRDPRGMENKYYRVELAPGRRGVLRIVDNELDAVVAGWGRGPAAGPAARVAPFPGLAALAARFTVPPQEFYENPDNLKRGGTGEGLKFLGRAWGPHRFRAREALLRRGRLAQRLTISGTFMGCPVTHEIVLHKTMKRIDLNTKIEWRGRAGVFLAMLLPLPFSMRSLRIGNPYHAKQIRDEAEPPHLIPGGTKGPRLRGVHHWFCCGNDNVTVTVSSDVRMWDFTFAPVAFLMGSDNRGGFFTQDDYLQKGAHRWRFSLCSHAGDWKRALSHRRGVEPLHEPVCRVIEPAGNGALPERSELLRISPDKVDAEVAVSQTDHGALFIRLCEMHGRATEAVLEFPRAVARAARTDLLENETAPLHTQGRTVRCNMNPYEIVHLLIRT